MPPVYVIVWYDCEDYVAPASDDAALRLADLHTQCGVPATFKVVGEKARTLHRRGREDVLAALRRHDIGYHTNYHSVHPTITEICEALPWDEGLHRLRQTERPGYEDVFKLLNGRISTFGQPGGAWAPQLYPMLREWGVTTYVDEGPWIGWDGQPFWFMGLLHVQRMERSLIRFSLRHPGDELRANERFTAEVERLQAAGGGMISVYFHPCEWTTDQFWDAANFAAGANPPLDQLVSPALTPAAEVERRFAAFETFLAHIAQSGAVGVTSADLGGLYPDGALGRPYGARAIVAATADWDGFVDAAATPHGWLAPAELLTTVAGLLRDHDYTTPGSAHRAVQPQQADGPRGDWPALAAPYEVSLAALREAAEFVQTAVGERLGPPPRTASGWTDFRPVPTAIPLGERIVQPAEFLLAAIRALRAVVAGLPPATVTVTPAVLRTAERVRHDERSFAWLVFPTGFDAPQVMAHARRQAWTMKPATLQPAKGD